MEDKSLEDQPFLRMARFNMKMTPELKQAVPGLFHVTTTEAWPQILQEGLKPGKDLPRVGGRGGRADIHLLVAPPYPNDKLKNERLLKMYKKGFEEVIVICIKKGALNLAEAGINQQGVILQGTKIHPVMFLITLCEST